MSQTGTGKPPHSQTLDRGIRVLEALAGEAGPSTVATLAATLGVHRSIVYRILRTLEDHRMVARRPDGSYELGLGLSALAGSVSGALQTAALPELTELAGDLGMTAFLVVADRGDAVTVASVEPRHSTAHVAYRPGRRHPIDRGAPGLALLAGSPARSRERPEVATARQRGYATSRGEVLPGMSAVGVPVLDRAGEVVAAVAVVYVAAGTSYDEATIGKRVMVAAHNIAAEMP